MNAETMDDDELLEKEDELSDRMQSLDLLQRRIANVTSQLLQARRMADAADVDVDLRVDMGSALDIVESKLMTTERRHNRVDEELFKRGLRP